MSESRRKYRRPRLNPGERTRLLAEVAKLSEPPIEAEIAALRAALIAQGAERDGGDDPPDEDAAAEETTMVEAHPEPDADAEDAAPLIYPLSTEPDDPWDALPRIPVEVRVLERNLIVTAERTDPAFASFDVLRTRIVQAMHERGWRRVAVTSPTQGCGKSFTALNLGIALSRYQELRTVLLDLDLRRPSLARYLGRRDVGSLGDVLRGHVRAEDHLVQLDAGGARIGRGLAVGLNDRTEAYASELFQQPATAKVLHGIEMRLKPDVMLFDLPPALAQDDVIALAPHFDCILLVIGGGITKPAEVREVTRRLGEDKPVLGLVLNMAEDGEDDIY